MSKSPFSASVQAAGWCSYCTQVTTDMLAQGRFTKVELIDVEPWASTVHIGVIQVRITDLNTTKSVSCTPLCRHALGVEPYDVYRWTHSTRENILWGVIKLGLSFFFCCFFLHCFHRLYNLLTEYCVCGRNSGHKKHENIVKSYKTFGLFSHIHVSTDKGFKDCTDNII